MYKESGQGKEKKNKRENKFAADNTKTVHNMTYKNWLTIQM